MNDAIERSTTHTNHHQEITLSDEADRIFGDTSVLARLSREMQDLAANIREFNGICKNGMKIYDEERKARREAAYDEIIPTLKAALASAERCEAEIYDLLRDESNPMNDSH